MASARESKLYQLFLHFGNKEKHLNYVRCCECKPFSTSAALQRLMLHLLAFSLPVVHLYLNISHTICISKYCDELN